MYFYIYRCIYTYDIMYGMFLFFHMQEALRKISSFLAYFSNSSRYALWTLQWQEGQLVQCPFDAAGVNCQSSQLSVIVLCTVTSSADPRIVCTVHWEPLCRRSRSPNPLQEGKSQHWLSRSLPLLLLLFPGQSREWHQAVEMKYKRIAGSPLAESQAYYSAFTSSAEHRKMRTIWGNLLRWFSFCTPFLLWICFQKQTSWVLLGGGL